MHFNRNQQQPPNCPPRSNNGAPVSRFTAPGGVAFVERSRPQQEPQSPQRCTAPASTPSAPALPAVGSSSSCSPATSNTSNLTSASKCSHAATTCPSQPLSTEHYRKQLEQYREAAACGSETARVNSHLNEIFLKRLQDIDCNADGDVDLKLLTYQEWVDMLLKINESIISNMEGLETEVVERLEVLNCKANAANCRQSQSNELAKTRKDVCTLMKVIQNGYHNDNWSLQGLKFETLSPAQVLGLNDRQMRCVAVEGGGMQSAASSEAAMRNKLILNVKALAVEVAGKHDEIRELKQQILCLEDDIQKAQKKIQLKDDVIRELRSDLKIGNSKISCQAFDLPCLPMAPINLESPTTRSTTTQVSGRMGSNRYPYGQDYCSHFESLSHNEQGEQGEQDKLKELEDELNELFEMTKDLKKQNLEYHRKRLSDIFQKSECEKSEAYRKLDYIRRQLIDLEATGGSDKWNDCDSGFSSKSETNQDAKILEALRKRLRRLNECSFELKKRVQKLEIENNEMCTNMETEKSFSQRNSETLKEVADLLCNMTGKQFNYNDIYDNEDQQNPFCMAILQLQQSFCDHEQKFIRTLKCKNKKIEDLEENLYNSQHESAMGLDETMRKQCQHQAAFITATQENYITMIDDLKRELDSLSTEVSLAQQELDEPAAEQEQAEQSFQSSLQELVTQNERLQQALEQAAQEKAAACLELQKNNDSLKCQIDHLQHTICEKEQCISQLNTMLTRLSSMTSDPLNICNCCGRSGSTGSDPELRELRTQLDQTRCRVESLLCELERSQKQERFLHAETRKLSDELLQNKRKNNDFICQIRRLATLLKSQEAHRMDLAKKFEIMEQNYGEQSKKLRAANAQLDILQERFCQMDKRSDEQTMERNLLREEVLALKDKEACILAKLKELQEQLVKTERELLRAHEVIKEQRCILQRNNCAHKDIVSRLHDTSNDIKRQLDAVVQDYKRLEEEYKRQGDICAQNEKVIESFRKWKEAQLQADETSRNSFKQYEEHIKLLLEEKQNFLERFRDMHRDYCILQNELERMKLCSYSTPASSPRNINNTMGQRADLLRHTYRRIADKCNTLQGDCAPIRRMPSAPS